MPPELSTPGPTQHSQRKHSSHSLGGQPPATPIGGTPYSLPPDGGATTTHANPSQPDSSQAARTPHVFQHPPPTKAPPDPLNRQRISSSHTPTLSPPRPRDLTPAASTTSLPRAPHIIAAPSHPPNRIRAPPSTTQPLATARATPSSTRPTRQTRVLTTHWPQTSLHQPRMPRLPHKLALPNAKRLHRPA